MSLKYDTNELIIKQKQTHRHRKEADKVTKEKIVGGGIRRYKILHIK